MVKIGDLFNPAKGQVMRLSVSSSHTSGFEQFDKVIYDRSAATNDNTIALSIVTTSDIGQFATGAGVTIKDSMGQTLPLLQAVLHRSDSSGDQGPRGVHGLSQRAPGGALPSTYDVTSPSYTKRWICTNGC